MFKVKIPAVENSTMVILFIVLLSGLTFLYHIQNQFIYPSKNLILLFLGIALFFVQAIYIWKNASFESDSIYINRNYRLRLVALAAIFLFFPKLSLIIAFPILLFLKVEPFLSQKSWATLLTKNNFLWIGLASSLFLVSLSTLPLHPMDRKFEATLAYSDKANHANGRGALESLLRKEIHPKIQQAYASYLLQSSESQEYEIRRAAHIFNHLIKRHAMNNIHTASGLLCSLLKLNYSKEAKALSYDMNQFELLKNLEDSKQCSPRSSPAIAQATAPRPTPLLTTDRQLIHPSYVDPKPRQARGIASLANKPMHQTRNEKTAQNRLRLYSQSYRARNPLPPQ